MQYYRENAKWLERTYAFVPRIGLDKIRAIVVDDSEGIAADLDAADANLDRRLCRPWLDRDNPRVPGQFGPRCPWRCCQCRSATRRSSRLSAPSRTARPGPRRERIRDRPDANRGTCSAQSTRSRWGRAARFGVGGDQVAVFRLRDGRVRALSAVCPHRGGPRRWSDRPGEVVICPLHLNAFELDTGCSSALTRSTAIPWTSATASST